MARAAKEEPEEGRKKKKKTGVGTILNRLLIVTLLGGCAYLYGQTIHLENELNATRSQLTVAARQADSAKRAAPGKAASRKNPVAVQASADYLAEAQTHTQNAEKAISTGNLGDAWRESQAATVAARSASLEASAQTQKTLTEIKGRLDSVQGRATKLWQKAGG